MGDIFTNQLAKCAVDHILRWGAGLALSRRAQDKKDGNAGGDLYLTVGNRRYRRTNTKRSGLIK
jgi:hypothetical protein